MASGDVASGEEERCEVRCAFGSSRVKRQTRVNVRSIKAIRRRSVSSPLSLLLDGCRLLEASEELHRRPIDDGEEVDEGERRRKVEDNVRAEESETMSEERLQRVSETHHMKPTSR